LDALQAAALGKDNKKLHKCIDDLGLSENARLAECLQVDQGWECAVETVLGNHLESICIDDLETVKNKFAEHLPRLAMMLLERSSTTLSSNTTTATNTPTATSQELANATLLSTKVKTELPISSLVENIFVTTTLDEAFELKKNLATNESIITKDGVWLGSNWLKLHAGDDERSGVLQREQDLKEINTKIDKLVISKEQHDNDIDILDQEAVELSQKQAEQRKAYSGLQNKLRELSNELTSVKTRYEYMERRSEQLKKEYAELTQQLSSAQEVINSSRTVLAKAIEDMAYFSEDKTLLLKQKEEFENALISARGEVKEHSSLTHNLEVERKTLGAKNEAITDSLARLNKHLAALCEKRNNLQQLLETDDTPVDKIKAELDELLAQQLAAEKELNLAKDAVEEIEQAIRAFEKERAEVEDHSQNIRNELEEFRMARQTIQVRRQTIEEEVVERGTTIETAVANLSVDAEIELWQENIEKLVAKINRLGPINLAAISEYTSEVERKEYLDSQHEDLSSALATLENAIKSIDKETRTKFKETFDIVNENFKKLFPKLFGGGRAYLELVGEDLLDAGVGVIAQPPGKKNSSIHLLSGGEKALTAVALVFGIFQLNPAPFCMLDEVDAPLDDANVGRFCDLIMEMSTAVQFIIITHNKITMEISKQLAGVTMKEPGVSRLVSVDIDEAVTMGVQ
jgi:chromosome segregation protein